MKASRVQIDEPTRPTNFPKFGNNRAMEVDAKTTVAREHMRPGAESRKTFGLQPSRIFQTAQKEGTVRLRLS
eukprot:scaffold5759_cov68-Cylindrotheca_fusiformis.AAC.2